MRTLGRDDPRQPEPRAREQLAVLALGALLAVAHHHHFQVEDRRGILADVSAKIVGINTNIRNVEATTTDQMGRIDMTVEISDVKHLQKVIKSLRSIAGVVDVERASR